MKPLITIELEEYEKFKNWKESQDNKMFLEYSISVFDQNTSMLYQYKLLNHYNEQEIYSKVREKIEEVFKYANIESSLQLKKCQEQLREFEKVKSKWYYKLFNRRIK